VRPQHLRQRLKKKRDRIQKDQWRAAPLNTPRGEEGVGGGGSWQKEGKQQTGGLLSAAYKGKKIKKNSQSRRRGTKEASRLKLHRLGKSASWKLGNGSF